MSNKIKKERLVYLASVGTLLCPDTFMTYVAPSGLVADNDWNLAERFDVILICNLEVDIFEGIHFEDCVDEWFENLSRQDLQTVVRLMSSKLYLKS